MKNQKIYDPKTNKRAVHTNYVEVKGHKIFYRESGIGNKPKMILYHGFPGSSAYYRNLIKDLADTFHCIAPDLLGFGHSDKPDPATYDYTFEDEADIMEAFQEKMGFTYTGMYLQDYGGPVGMRIIGRHPEWLEWLIIQNTNGSNAGFTEVWGGIRGAYWKNKNEETEAPLKGFLTPETTKQLYQHGHKHPELVAPESWENDIYHLQHPFAERINLDLFYDYRTNADLYDTWSKMLNKLQPKTQIFWGKGDIFFTPEGGTNFLKDLPNADFHWLDSGHFALEDSAEYIADEMKRFYKEEVKK